MKIYRSTKDTFFLKDGDVKIRLSRRYLGEHSIAGVSDEIDGLYIIDGANRVFDSSRRTWDADAGSHFYPDASVEAIEWINKAIELINAKESS